MFTRPQPQQPEFLTRQSVLQPPRIRRTRAIGLLKRAVAVLVIAISAAAFTQHAGYVTSDAAVVTAHLVLVRAPIEGVVESAGGTVGTPVAAGAELARIANPLVDDRPVADLRLRLVRLDADLDGMRQQDGSLQAFLDDLTGRAERHRAAKVRQLGFDADRSDRDRAAKLDEFQQLVRDMNRKVALRGTIAQADIEQATTAVRVAAQQLASLDRQLAAAQDARADADSGVMVEPNSANDVAYSEQRADEVRLRLLELRRAIRDTQAEAKETAGRIVAQTAMLAKQQAAVLTAPLQGMVWRLGAAAGERVAPGDMLAEIVDCRTAFLAVHVPQDRLADIDLAQPASFRLAGEAADRSAPIVGITGDAALRGDGALAAVPQAGEHPEASLVIAVPPSANEVGRCLVGRTARVLLPTLRNGWLAWFRHWL